MAWSRFPADVRSSPRGKQPMPVSVTRFGLRPSSAGVRAGLPRDIAQQLAAQVCVCVCAVVGGGVSFLAGHQLAGRHCFGTRQMRLPLPPVDVSGRCVLLALSTLPTPLFVVPATCCRPCWAVPRWCLKPASTRAPSKTWSPPPQASCLCCHTCCHTMECTHTFRQQDVTRMRRSLFLPLLDSCGRSAKLNRVRLPRRHHHCGCA